MEANSPRWHRVTPSTFPWEDEAIDFLRSGIGDADPNRGWSNFEFISGGVISEVDVLLLTRKGAFLIEVKSTPGRLVGDQQSWTFHKPDGRRTTMENPLLGANRKAKRIKSLLEHKWSSLAPDNASSRPPFIQPLVFLSDPDLVVELTRDARVHVCGRDGSSVVEGGSLPGIVAAAAQIGPVEVNDSRFRQLNTPTTTAVAKALKAIGIKESNRTRTVGSWVLRLDTVSERPGIQDFVADHTSSKGAARRVRIYSRQPGMSDEQATSLKNAADREFVATERLKDLAVVAADDLIDTDLGAAVVFPYDPKALRLDHWLAEHPDVDVSVRLDVLRQLAETLRSVHRRKVTHRALSPGSILVRPGRTGEQPWMVSVADFSLAGRGHDTAADGSRSTMTATRMGLATAAPGEVEMLADEAALRYQAPEVFSDTDPDGVSVDVFSFGAVAFHVLSGRPPGESRESVFNAVRASGSLQLAAAVPGVSPGFHGLVEECTTALVSDRAASFDDVLAALDLAEEELTAPDELTLEAGTASTELDPLDAVKGNRLGDGSLVVRRLGRGSTARALLVDRGPDAKPREVVYKVAVSSEAEVRLRDEGRILAELRHDAIVELFDQVDLAGRAVLVEAVAGKQSLADELRTNGSPGAEFLHRWGNDLLGAVRYLERMGRSHRDIKPDNLGVTEVGPNKAQHLVLFDFSLGGASDSDVHAGTPPYLDPFVSERGKWDAAGELYAAAVTLYEMAAGETPKWGDGRSNPAVIDDEASVDALLFDPAVRDRLAPFFERALRRNAAERFGNAEEMASAWDRIFDQLDVAATQPGTDQVSDSTSGDSDPGHRRPLAALPDGLSLDDPVSSLGASGRVVSALARIEVATVRQLAGLSPVQVNQARRISPRVRRRIIELRAAILARFEADLAATPPSPTPPAATATDAVVEVEPPRLDLDALVPYLVPVVKNRGNPGVTAKAVRLLLGLEPLSASSSGASADWPSQAAVADELEVTRGRIGQVGPSVRKQWAALSVLVPVRDTVADLLAANGGVMAISEIQPLVIESLGSGLPADQARRAARAVVRAAVDSEDLAAKTDDRPARWIIRRSGDRVLVALHGEVDEVAFDGAALASYAVDLGTRADQLVATADDVVPQDRAVAALRAVTAPSNTVLSDGRLVRLAAGASQGVGVSSSLELYPCSLDPVRAVRLARQGLATAGSLTVDDVQRRIRARFPAVQLPERPELDEVLRNADVAVTWRPLAEGAAGDGVYQRADTAVGGVATMTTGISHHATRHQTPTTPATDPGIEAANAAEARLLGSLERGGFLALRVPASRGPELRRELARYTGEPHGMRSVDLEAWFLEELRQAATARNVVWDRLATADAEPVESNAGVNLRIFTQQAIAAVEQRVLDAGPRVVVWNPGCLARYSQMGVIDRWRHQAGTADANLRTLWLVTFGPTTESRPTIDGQPVPVLGTSEWVDLPDPWLGNQHRHEFSEGRPA